MLSEASAQPEVNPYSRWVYDHPAHLLPEPTPALLASARASATVAPKRTIVELGSGSGNFLLQLGQIWPEDQLIGFEIRFKRLVKTARKLEKAGLNHVWLLRERAERFASYFAPGSVDRVYLNFPDPWRKPGQWKKRLVREPFLAQLETTLSPGGTFRLKTDHSGYFLHCISQFNRRSGWNFSGFSNHLHRSVSVEPYPKTEFELLFSSKRKAIYALTAKWNGHTRQTG